MDNEPIQFDQPTSPWLASRRDVLWHERTHLHRQFGMSLPTATLTMEDVEAQANRLQEQRAAQQGSVA